MVSVVVFPFKHPDVDHNLRSASRLKIHYHGRIRITPENTGGFTGGTKANGTPEKGRTMAEFGITEKQQQQVEILQ